MVDALPYQRLGVNIDHVATLRNTRGNRWPCPIRAAQLAAQAGADGITAHLREDRRHIRDEDIYRLRREVDLPLNMEMATTEEMLAIALDVKPHACCIVPERREELTTEGGLDVVGNREILRRFAGELRHAGIRVSLFIDADAAQIAAASEVNADIVELHTGKYCDTAGITQQEELARIQQAASLTAEYGLECHAGHGLTYDNVGAIAAIPQLVELNIGHFLMGEAVFTGLEWAVKRMRECMVR